MGALRRLEQLIQEAVVTVPRALIAETIDLIAVLSGRGSARRLAELARRHVSPVAPRREHIERDQAEDRGGQAEKRQDGHAAARPVLDLERIARAQNQIERIGAEGAQEQRERLEDGPSHQQNNFSYRFRNMAAVTPQI